MASFVKIGVVKSIYHISAEMNFYPYFPHLFYDLCEIQQKTVSHMIFIRILWKPEQENPTFMTVLKWEYTYASAVKLRDFLRATNILITSACYVWEYVTRNFSPYIAFFDWSL